MILSCEQPLHAWHGHTVLPRRLTFKKLYFSYVLFTVYKTMRTFNRDLFITEPKPAGLLKDKQNS